MPPSAATPTESGAAKPARERLAQEEELQPQEEELEAQVKMERRRARRRRKENWAFGCSSSAALSC